MATQVAAECCMTRYWMPGMDACTADLYEVRELHRGVILSRQTACSRHLHHCVAAAAPEPRDQASIVRLACESAAPTDPES